MSRARVRIAVVGGGGAMGRITVRDLAETSGSEVDIVVADRDVAAARRATAGLGRRVRVAEVDATNRRSLTNALAGTHVLVNALHHDFNLRVMDAALATGSHYLDLGGLFHVTRRQLRRHKEFSRAGLLALCGMGSAPGIVNVMARAGGERLDRVTAIHVAVGTVDHTAWSGAALLDTSYSIQTVLDEASQPAAVFRAGRLAFVPPLSGAEGVDFPKPVGRQYPACTLHSEVATLPASFRHKGVRDVTFKIAFPGDLADRLRFVHGLGLTSTEPARIGRATVAPRDVLLALLATAPRPVAAGPLDQYEVLRVTLTGTRGGRTVTDVHDCHVTGMPSWGVGVDIDTGAPPSIVAQMLAAGTIKARGVLPPEQVVPPVPFFRELRRRGMIVRRKTVGARKAMGHGL